VDPEISSELRAIASRVLAWEEAQPSGTCAPIVRALERLRATMLTLVGPRGFDAILRRALHLAKRDHAWLGDVPIASARELEPLAAECARVGEPRATAASVALLASVLHLFSVFLGEDLTRLQGRRAWGAAPFDMERPTPPEEK